MSEEWDDEDLRGGASDTVSESLSSTMVKGDKTPLESGHNSKVNAQIWKKDLKNSITDWEVLLKARDQGEISKNPGLFHA